MARTVILKHDEGANGLHFDWLIAPDEQAHGDDDRVLIHFRCASSPAHLTHGETMEAQRGGPHRSLYLDFEGEMAGGRGHVTRIAQGETEILEDTPSGLELRVRWGEAWQRWEALHEVGERWILERKS